MCINFETSLVSFLLGEISGFILSRHGDEKKGIGIFVMYYSLIQLIEMIIHKFGDKSNILSKSHLVNLGSQGIVFFLLMKYISNKDVENYQLYINGIISILILGRVLFFDHKINKNKCLDYNLDKYKISKLLFVQYALMLYYLFTNRSEKLNKMAYYFSVNIILTFILEKILKTNDTCIASYWCLSSAILAPIINFIL